MPDDVAELVRQSLLGDQAAMRELVQRFEGLVYGVCLRMLGRPCDAEEVAQEVFVRALRSLGGFDVARGFQPWLLAIAGNRCRTWLAQRAKRPSLAPLCDEQPDPRPDTVAHGMLSEEVAKALAGLREEHRQAFRLFCEQELSYDEIAAALDCPAGTAKTWVHRARRQLAAELIRRGVVEESRI